MSSSAGSSPGLIPALIPAAQARSIVELEVELEVVGINLRLAVKERDQVGIVRQTRIF